MRCFNGLPLSAPPSRLASVASTVFASAGVFRALSALCPDLPAYYESAKANQDLRLGGTPSRNIQSRLAFLRTPPSNPNSKSGQQLFLVGSRLP